MRICFLLTGLSGYFSACLEALARLDADVTVLSLSHAPNVAFSPDELAPAGVTLEEFATLPPGRELLGSVTQIRPDVLFSSGWQVAPYRYVARHLQPRPVRVVFMDSQWLGTAKQRLGVLTSQLYLHPFYDAVFLPGDRQASFARKLGFRDDQIWRGLYSCEHARFASIYSSRNAGARSASPPSFVFVGRLVATKGVDVLASAYRRYRASTVEPWGLVVCGIGPMDEELRGIEGVDMRGFVQPRDLPAIFRDADGLVLPSRFEPWGVVVHEAAAAGLPIICTTCCGSVPHLVEPGYNGFLVEPGNAAALARAMLRLSSASEADRAEMARNGHHLSLRYTPERWAQTVWDRSHEALAGR